VDEFFSGSSRLPSCLAAEPKTPEMLVELIGRGFAPVATVFHSSRCANTETSIRPKRDDFLLQGC
jgi:hypothetical protein